MATFDSRAKDSMVKQLTLVSIIKQNPELLDTSQRPEIRDRKRQVLEEITQKLRTEYGVKCKSVQVLKKIQNMKTRIKKKIEIRMSGNKSVKFKPWEKEFCDLMFGKSNPIRRDINSRKIDILTETCATKMDVSQLLEKSGSAQEDHLYGSSRTSQKTRDTVNPKQNHELDESDDIKNLSLGDFPVVVLEEFQDELQENHGNQPDEVHLICDIEDSNRVCKEANSSLENGIPEESPKIPSKISRKTRPLLIRRREVEREGTTAVPEISKLLQHLDTIVQNTAEDKPYDHFGKYVADELRQLPQRQAILLQQKIQNCITRYRLFCLGSHKDHDLDIMSLSSSDSNDFSV